MHPGLVDDHDVLLARRAGAERPATGQRDWTAVGPLERNAAMVADHPAGLAAFTGRKVLAALGTPGLLAVTLLVEVDGHLDHLVSHDEVAAVPPLPHTRRF
jgi:hypothetical protein